MVGSWRKNRTYKVKQWGIAMTQTCHKTTLHDLRLGTTVSENFHQKHIISFSPAMPCRELSVSREDDETKTAEDDDQSAGWSVWACYVTI